MYATHCGEADTVRLETAARREAGLADEDFSLLRIGETRYLPKR